MSLILFKGRHCCLWCTITYNMMKVSKQDRGRSPNRTLASLQQDLIQFREKFHGDLKYAKEVNNVVDDIFFDIPLNQVNNF